MRDRERYVSVRETIFTLLEHDVLPIINENVYRNFIRGLPREEFAEAVKRLHQDLKKWDTKKTKDATPEQERAMVRAWLQRDRDMEEEKHRPLEEEEEHITYPESGMTKYMNIMRELNVVNTEEEEAIEGGETNYGKKREGEEKEEGGNKEEEGSKDSEEAEGTGKDDGKDQEKDDTTMQSIVVKLAP